MHTSVDAIIDCFKALKIEFNKAERRLRQTEEQKTRECNAMFFEISSKYIQSVLNQLEEFEEYWKDAQAQSDEQCSNIEYHNTDSPESNETKILNIFTILQLNELIFF